METLSPLSLLLSVFSLASMGGLASMLRSNRRITTRSIVSAMLNSGLVGVIIAGVWIGFFGGKEKLFFMVAVSVLAGMGGWDMLSIGLKLFLHGIKLDVTVQHEHEERIREQGRAQGRDQERERVRED